jgi:hypothetical protein
LLTIFSPYRGENLTITAKGSVSKDVEDGAYVFLTVKYGYIQLIKTKADICEQAANADVECPIEKGPITFTKTVTLPKEIPKGTYNVHADAFTVDDEQLTCIDASVAFA